MHLTKTASSTVIHPFNKIIIKNILKQVNYIRLKHTQFTRDYGTSNWNDSKGKYTDARERCIGNLDFVCARTAQNDKRDHTHTISIRGAQLSMFTAFHFSRTRSPFSFFLLLCCWVFFSRFTSSFAKGTTYTHSLCARSHSFNGARL